MLAIKFSEIPAYLHEGKFYRMLEQSNQPGAVHVPPNSFKENPNVSNVDDFTQLLQALRFWGVDELPTTVVDYCFQHNVSEWKTLLLEVMGEGSEVALALIETFSAACDRRLIVAIRAGRVDIVSYLIPSYRSVCSTDFTATAAECGQLRCLKLLHEQEFPWDQGTYIGAIEGGHFDCFQYAHANGLEWSAEVANAAAKQGRPDFLRYAVDHGCPHATDIVQIAAEGGNLACLQYLIGEKHLPMNEEVFRASFVRADVCCVQYLLESQCPYKDYKFSGELVWHYAPDKMDNNFLLCLDFAQDYHWSPSTELRQYVQLHADKLPLSCAYIANMP